jgi:hypothetical protein
MRSLIIKLVNFILVLFFLLGAVFFLFYHFNIFQVEYKPDQQLDKLKTQLEFIKNYKFTNLNSYLLQLSATKTEIKKISSEEIGKQSLF